jgi:hypothetical protein|tara:strand:+ start:40947 stop:41525 length:579 start_codon:yes stop_codon:yes gene_type:complete
VALVELELAAAVLLYMETAQADEGSSTKDDWSDALADAVVDYFTPVDLGTFSANTAHPTSGATAATSGPVTPTSSPTFDNLRSGLKADVATNEAAEDSPPQWATAVAGWATDIALITNVKDTGGYSSAGSTSPGTLDLSFFSTLSDTRTISDVANDFASAVHSAATSSVFSGSPPVNATGLVATDTASLNLQ